MREFSVPVAYEVKPGDNVTQDAFTHAHAWPDGVGLKSRVNGRWIPVTWREFTDQVNALAAGLIGAGVSPGDRVALMSRTRYEWTLVDFAILSAGGVVVPIYPTSSLEQVEWILSDSGAVAAIAETDVHAHLVATARGNLPALQHVWVIDNDGLSELRRLGTDISPDEVSQRRTTRGAEDLAEIVYTSGTTGRPKGCMLTHGNLRTNVRQNLDALGDMLQDDEVTLLFLPLAHALTKAIALVCVEWGAQCVFATDVPHLPEELLLARPTLLVGVPRIFEKVFNSAQHKAESEGHGGLFDKAAEVAIQWSRDQSDGFHPVTTVEHAAFEPLVYSKIREAFGSRLRFAFSGGGPLGERLTHFFNGIGVKVLEGYGLTETSPTLTVNSAEAWKPGTVGRPVAGTSIKIALDGEIFAKGPQVFPGYWRNDAATADTFDDEGWFKTGDIGEIDDEGFVRITGRKKDLIVTAAGKNVAPEPLEDQLRAHPLISQAIVVGDSRPFIAALLTVDVEALTTWASEHGLDGSAMADLLRHPDLMGMLQSAIDAANRTVSRAESIRKFAVLPKDLTIDAGELTPTLKVRRAVVGDAYGDVIDGLYST
jgi:long-chain acyl-CoA synthetase